MSDPSPTWLALKNGIMLVFLIVPTMISIMVAFQLKTLKNTIVTVDDATPHIICFTTELCAIEVHDIWYRIDGIIDSDKIMPDEYKLILPDEPLLERYGIRNSKPKE
jgi:hypothetical protein